MRRSGGARQTPRRKGAGRGGRTGRAENVHLPHRGDLPPLDRRLHPGAAIRRRDDVGRYGPARRIGRSEDRPRDGKNRGHGAPAPFGVRRRNHPARREALPADLAVQHRARIFAGERKTAKDPQLPLSGRRLGPHDRRREALHVGRHGHDPHGRSRDVPPRKARDGDLQGRAGRIPQRTGVDRRQNMGQRLHHRPDRRHRPRDGRRRGRRRPRGAAARNGNDRDDRRAERHRL